MNLAHLQLALQAHVLNGDSAIEAAINRSEAVPAATRLAVYADAYRLRLADALAHNYPRLQQLLGTENFAVLARAYLQTYPSTDASVRWFGHRLADYLRQHHPDSAVPAELARWEWAIAAAFDARDAASLTEEALSAIDPALWTTLRLQLHPSVQLLRMDTNAPALFKALSGDAEPPPAQTLPASQRWIIWRQGMTPRYRSVADDEWATLQAVESQATFEQLCEVLCDWHAPEDVPPRAVILLKGWIRDEMILEEAVGG